MTRVLFATEGGASIGFGHLARCFALSQAFEERGVSSGFVIAGDMTAKNVLGTRNLDLCPWFEEEEALFQKMADADIVIADSYRIDEALYDKVSKRARIPVYLDDSGRLEISQGVLINGNLYAANLRYPKKSGITYLLGPEYISLRKPFWEIGEKKIRKKVERVLVSFGGDDSKRMTPQVLRFLTRQYPKMTKNVIIGRAFEKTKDIENMADNYTTLIEAPDAEEMKRVMLTSDLAITSGGQTLLELARVGLPAVVVAVADNQRKNIEAWEKNRFIEFAGYWDEKDLVENISMKFRLFLDHAKRHQSRDAGRRIVTGNGARKIVQFLVEKLNS